MNIMLVDDDIASHTYHKIMITQVLLDNANVQEHYSVESAIRFLADENDKSSSTNIMFILWGVF